MLHTVKTFNGHTLNSASYQTVLLNPHGMPNSNPVFIEQANADSRDAGVFMVDIQTKVLTIKILNYANRYALIAQLKTWFKRGAQGNIVVTFGDDAVDYQMSGRVVSLIQDGNSNQFWQVILQTGISAWRAVTETTQATWTATGTTETQAISVAGKDETFLSVDLTASAMPGSGYLHQDIYRLPNTPGIAHGLISWCITVNTAALVTAGKMQADCDDLRIVDMNTGQEFKRWISGPNTTTTKVWIVIDLAKGYSLTLATAVASSGDVGYLQFDVTDNMKARISEMPRTGIVYHGNEWFSYNNTDASNCRLYISQRGLFGTTEEAHSVGVAFLYIQYPLLMKYGNSAATDPALTDTTYDATKPVFDLANSSNTLWFWGGSYPFYDTANPGRTGMWTQTQRSLGRESKIFYVVQLDGSGYKSITFEVKNYLVGGVFQAENVEFTGTLFRAAGITSIVVTGKKYRTNGNWLDLAAFRGSLDGITYVNLFTEASPSIVFTVENWSNNSVSQTLATGAKFAQMIFRGGWPQAFKEYADFELHTATANFNSSNIPTGAFLGEDDGYPLVVTLENETTGDQVMLNYNVLLGKIFSINGENNSVQYDGYNSFGALTLDDESRSVYLRLVGGATNTIRISGADLGTLGISLHWFARRL